jgi:nucleoside-diphosphate-sugar epimerase
VLHLVTGGSGYFGSLLVRSLLERGHKVRVFDLVDAEDCPPEVEFVQGDIRDESAICHHCKGVGIIHHNVAQVPLAKDKRLFWSVNVIGTENLLKAALYAKVDKVIIVSSSAVFGVPSKNPVDDTIEPNPQEEYGRAKRQGEIIAQQFVNKGLDITIIRPRTILGHGRLGIFQILFDWISRGHPVYVLGRGNNRYQFVHADDLADACIRAAERPGFAIYNIGAEKFCTMRETLEGLIFHAQTGSKIRSLPFSLTVLAMNVTSRLGLSPLGPYHSLMYGREMFFDITKPKQELGWQPKWGNIEMFIQSYEWYLANKDKVLQNHQVSPHRSVIKQGVLSLLQWLP